MSRRKREPTMSARDAYELAGCDGDSMAADFIAMEMAGYDPSDHGDFLMDALGGVGGDPEYHRETRQKAAKRVSPWVSDTLKKLGKLGVEITTHNDGLHLGLHRGGKKIGDYWPTRGKWKLDSGRGVGGDDLLKAVKKLPSPEKREARHG